VCPSSTDLVRGCSACTTPASYPVPYCICHISESILYCAVARTCPNTLARSGIGGKQTMTLSPNLVRISLFSFNALHLSGIVRASQACDKVCDLSRHIFKTCPIGPVDLPITQKLHQYPIVAQPRSRTTLDSAAFSYRSQAL